MPPRAGLWWRELQGGASGRALRRAGLAALALASGLAAAALSQVPAWALLEARAFDHLSMIAPPPRPADTPLVVAIDEPSFAELGQQWPWSRDTHARLVAALRQAGARTIALDIVFAEASQPAADRALAAAVGPDTVLAADESVVETPQAVQLLRTDPLPALMEGGAVAGLSTIPLDRDGVARRLPGAADALARVLMERHGGLPPPRTPPGALLQFYGPARSMPTVSYYQALDPATFLPPGIFAGRDVIVGLSLQAVPTVEEGSADAFPTPATVRAGGLVAGAEIHATAVANLIAGDWIRPAGAAVGALATLAAAALAAALLWRARTRRVMRLALGAAALPLGCWLALRFGRLWLPPLAPMAAFAATAGGQTLLDFTAERRLRAGLTRAFSHYLAPALVERLARDPGALRLGGESRVITVLFCDIRGFTALSERLSTEPERLTTILHRLMEPLSQAVLDEQGTIDKYIGDCLMAFWNAPLDVPDHAARALAAGRRMIAAVARLNEAFAAEGIPPLAVGVGINTGACIVGNMGSGARFDYSVLGDAVNLASRLEGLTKEFGVPLIAGEATAAEAGPAGLKPIGEVIVRGRSAPTRLFTLAEA